MPPALARLRRGAVLPVVLGTGLALAAALAPAQAVTTDESVGVPVDNQLQIVGHGFGHGHGLNQYGAQGAAKQGLDWRSIVAFYYPGTTVGTTGGRISVLIGADNDGALQVRPRSHLGVRDLHARRGYTLPSIRGVRSWQLRVSQGRTLVRYRTTTLHTWRTMRGEAEFYAGGRAITLLKPGGSSTAYRGTLRLVRPPGARPQTVNVVSMESYLRGVVPREMPASWRPAALKAQTVAARTYAAWSARQNRGRSYQICDSTACQVYGGVPAEDPRTDAAIKAVRNKVLLYDGAPAFTQFSASSGGWTSAGAFPYLPAKSDPYDASTRSFTNPVHDWSVTVDARVLQKRFPALGTLQQIRIVSRDGNGEWQGRVQSLVLDGSKSDITISGSTFSSIYGLRSTWFDIENTPIMARWTALGGAGSPLGSPVSREVTAGSGGAVMQDFAGGRMYYASATGAQPVYGPVLNALLGAGGPAQLGMPTTATQPDPSGGVGSTWQQFQRAVIRCDTPSTTA